MNSILPFPARFFHWCIAASAILVWPAIRSHAGNPEPPNPKGSYGGIVENADVFDPLTAGLIEVKVTPAAQFTGRLTWQGLKYRFDGAFDSSTQAFERTFTKIDEPDTELVMRLTLDASTLTIAATVSEQVGGATTASAAGSLSGAPPDPAAADAYRGTRNVAFIDSPGYGTRPNTGDGFLVAKVGRNKKLSTRIVGRLPDDEPFSAGSQLRGTNFTIIAPLYPDGDQVGGQAYGDISAADPGNLNSLILWGKKAGAEPDYYPDGFATGVGISAGPYPKVNGVPAIGITASKLFVTVTLKDGNLGRLPNGDPIKYDIAVKILPFRTKVIGDNPLGLKIVTNGRQAAFKGSFIHPVTGEKIKFRGAFKASVGPTPGEGRGSFRGSVDADDPQQGPRESGSVRIAVMLDR